MSRDFVPSRRQYALSLSSFEGITPDNILSKDYYQEGFNFSGGISSTRPDRSIYHENKLDINEPNQIVRLTWITDPYLYTQHYDLINALQSNRFDLKLLESTKLYRNTIETVALIEINFDVNDVLTFGSIILSEDSPIDDLMDIISKINFVSLNFTLTFEDEEKQNPDYINGIVDIIKLFTMVETGIEIADVNTDMQGGDMILTPYTDMYQIYLTSAESTRIKFKLNPNNFYGYTTLSSDPLIIHALNKYSKKSPQVLSPDLFLIKDGMILLKIDIKPLDFNIVKDDLLGLLERSRHKQLIVLPSDSRISFGNIYGVDPDRLNIFRELAKRWRGTVKNSSFPIIIKSDVNFSIPVQYWYEQSADKILKGQLPIYRTNKPSQWNSESVLHQNKGNLRAKFMYSAVKSYTILIQKYPHLVSYFSSPRVYKDLSVEAAFSSYEEVEEYLAILKGELLPINETISHYSIIPIDNLTDAISVRGYFDIYRPEINTFIVEPLPEDEFKYFIVMSSYEHFSVENIRDEQIAMYRSEFTKMLHQYFDLCNYPGGTVDPDKMTLEQMIKLVPIYDPDSDRTACLPADLMDERSILFNPTTKQPYNIETISIYKNLRWGLLGYFTVGRLNGLMNTPPIRHKTWIELGYPFIKVMNLPLSGIDYKVDEISADISCYDNDLLVEPEGNKTFWSQIKDQYIDSTPGENLKHEDIGHLLPLLSLRLVPMSSPQYSQIIHGSSEFTGTSELASILEFTPQSLLSLSSTSPLTSNLSPLTSKPLNTNEGMVEQLIENLWRCGFFLDDWALSVYETEHKISRAPFKISSIVRQGGDGIYDGYNALVHLKINEMILC
jgi:hypothetical protein